MSNFPLYDSLNIDRKNEDLTFKEKDEFIKIVKNLDKNGHDLIYALIRTYQLENCEDKSTFKLPYGGKYVKTEIKFDLNDIPNELKNILYNFILKHQNAILEEKDIVQKRDKEKKNIIKEEKIMNVKKKKSKLTF